MEKPDYHRKIMELVGEDEELLRLVQGDIRESKISDWTYAKVFSDMFFARLGTNESISYSKAAGEWRRGRIRISDLKLVGLLATVCDIVRYAVLDSWQGCLVSALTEEKLPQKLERDLDDMETLEHLKSILSLAQASMTFTNMDGAFKWDDEETDDAQKDDQGA